MRRRSLLLGVPLLVASDALAQPMPLIGPVGGQPADVGPLWSLNAGPPGVTLDLSFMTGTMPSGVTFTRASTATYFDSTGTMQSAATNAPRFDYNPATLALNGLLIEEARTNANVVSVPNTTSWTVATSTLTPTATTAPDGTNAGTLLLDNATNASHGITANGTFAYTSGTNYAFSVYAKASSAHCLQIYTGGAAFTSAYANFDVTAGTVGTSAGGTASIQNAGNGWWRCTLVAAATTTASTAQFAICLTNNNTSALRNVGYVGTGAGVYLWGAQLETGAFPTSYIPTTGAAATRAVDVATIASIPGRNSAAESFAGEFNLLARTLGNNPRIFADSASTRAPLLVASALTAGSNDAAGTLLTANTLTGGAVSKLASNWATPNAGRACLNAGTVAGITTQTNGFASITTFKFMGDSAAADQATGYIRRLRYWPRILSDSELQSVTT